MLPSSRPGAPAIHSAQRSPFCFVAPVAHLLFNHHHRAAQSNQALRLHPAKRASSLISEAKSLDGAQRKPTGQPRCLFARRSLPSALLPLVLTSLRILGNPCYRQGARAAIRSAAHHAGEKSFQGGKATEGVVPKVPRSKPSTTAPKKKKSAGDVGAPGHGCAKSPPVQIKLPLTSTLQPPSPTSLWAIFRLPAIPGGAQGRARCKTCKENWHASSAKQSGCQVLRTVALEAPSARTLGPEYTDKQTKKIPMLLKDLMAAQRHSGRGKFPDQIPKPGPKKALFSG